MFAYLSLFILCYSELEHTRQLLRQSDTDVRHKILWPNTLLLLLWQNSILTRILRCHRSLSTLSTIVLIIEQRYK